MERKMKYKIGFVILDYYSQNDTLNLIDEVRKLFVGYFESSFVIVDNSEDGVWRSCNLIDEATTVLSGHGNIGYAAGNNKGISHFNNKADFIFVINPDIRFLRVDMEGLCNELSRARQKGICILSPQIKDVASYWNEPGLISLLLPYYIRYKDKASQKVLMDKFTKLYRFHGCGFIINQANITNEFFDSDTFLYFEEDLKCFKNDLLVYNTNKIQIDHPGSKSVNIRWGEKKYELMAESLELLLTKKYAIFARFTWLATVLSKASIFIRKLRESRF